MVDDLGQILVFLNRFSTLETLMDYCLEHNYLVHHEDIMRYLAIKKDDKKMKKYLLKVKEKLYKISDNAYAFYVQKSLKLKEEYTSSVSNDSTASSN
jgi:transcriptional regulator of NAD metabolism